MPEDSDFLKRIDIRSRALADQVWMELEERIGEILSLGMMLHTGMVNIEGNNRSLLKKAIGLLAYELSERLKARETQGET